MSIHCWSQDVILADLPRELEKHNELQTVTGMVRDRGDCDVLIDSSHVDVIGCACLAGLVEVRKLLNDCGQPKLVGLSLASPLFPSAGPERSPQGPALPIGQHG